MIILIILIIVLLLSFLIIKNLFKNETTILDEVKIQNNSSKNNGIALMLQKNDGTYEESTSSNWPSNMKFNSELSGCMDANGKKIDNSLNYNKNTNSIKLKVNGATYCYVYFDIREILSDYLIKNVSSEELWNSTLEDDGYRYVGTNPNNYICFGTSDKTTCTNDADTYMFRIIGVFEDSENNKHLKLIKNSKLKTLQSNSTTQFNNTFVWNSRTNQNVDWNNSDLYNGLNDDYFWSSSIYTYTYMTDPNETWRSKISTWKYIMANTKQYESNGVNYRYNTGKTVYLHELNKNDKLNQTCYNTSSSTANCNI